jgi:hypothetical protein
MTTKQLLLSGSVAFTCLVATAAIAGPIDNYSPVTAQRLENPEPGNWMLYRRTYAGLQPARPDQHFERQATDAGMDLLHRRDRGP